MPKPYREGRTWSIRTRARGLDIYLCGFATKQAAIEALAKRLADLSGRGVSFGPGPRRTTVAQALQQYAIERLPFMKGAAQEADRINRYLRAGGVATLRVAAVDRTASAAGQRFTVTLEPLSGSRRIPQGLHAHRARQAAQTTEAEQRRSFLMRLTMAEVQPYHVQHFLDALRKAGRRPATLQLERAVLRALFNYARRVWCWTEPASNPACGLKLPRVNNARSRVMSAEEQLRLEEALQTCRNAVVGPAMRLLAETAMRSSEALVQARWRDVDLERKVIRLRDSKTEQREVPLSPGAIAALAELSRFKPGDDDEAPIVGISYEALRAAWRRACERASVTDLRLHDLRHTAATRLALKTGNVFLVRQLTGHKTLSQLERYVNVTVDDAVAALHAPEPDATAAPAAAAKDPAPQEEGPTARVSAKIIRVHFRPRSA